MIESLTPRVKEIYQLDEQTLGITWTDDLISKFNVVELRKMCPCASCVDEQTGRRILDLKSISDATRPLVINSVGRYALTISFSDGHATGIYSFKYLRSL